MFTRFFLVGFLVLMGPTLVSAADKKGHLPPDAGTVFHLSPRAPSYITCDLEFRDPQDSFWPNFFYGKPAEAGSFTFAPDKPAAAFKIVFDTMVQKNGEQSRRVLGEMTPPEKPPVMTFTVKAMKKFEKETVEVPGKNGKPKKTEVEFAPLDAVLDINGKQVPVQAKATLQYHYGKGDKPESVYIDCRFPVQAGDLGLKKVTGFIDVRVGLTAFANTDTEKKK